MKVRIESDGTPKGTRVVNAATGEPVENVSYLRLEANGSAVVAVLAVSYPEISLGPVLFTMTPEPQKEAVK